MENSLGNSASKKQIVIAGIAVLVVIIIAVFWAFSSMRTPPVETTTEESAEAVRVAAEKATAPEVTVPTSANPIKQSLPNETPQQKTNPFNKTYVNPFE